MIFGESGEDVTFRYIAEESLLEGWLDNLEPLTAAEYGAQIGPIVREAIRAKHDDCDAWTVIAGVHLINQQKEFARSRGEDFNDYSDEDLKTKYASAHQAISAYQLSKYPDQPIGHALIDELIEIRDKFGRREVPSEPTGYKHIDNLLELQKGFIDGSGTAEEKLGRQILLFEARRAAEDIYLQTTPGGLAA